MTEEVRTVGVLPKLNRLRGRLVHCDWTPDGSMKISGTVIKYISISQIKAALAPLFSDCGLEFIPSMREPAYNESSRQWVVGIDFKILDVDSDQSETFTFYGAASGEKGMAVATTYALKMALSTMFCLADGIDPDKENINISSAFVPRTDREKEEVTSKIISQGVKPAEKPAEKPREPVKQAEKPAETTKTAEKPAAAPAPAPSPKASSAPISVMQGRTILNILAKRKDSMSEEEYTALRAEADACKTSDAARAFISKYRESD